MISTEHHNKSLSVENRKINWTDFSSYLWPSSHFLSLPFPLRLLACPLWLSDRFRSSYTLCMCVRVVFRVASSKMAFNFLCLKPKANAKMLDIRSVSPSVNLAVWQYGSQSCCCSFANCACWRTHTHAHSLTYIGYCRYCEAAAGFIRECARHAMPHKLDSSTSSLLN